MIRVSTQTAMAELILSGCTTSSDHLYIYPNGCRLDDSIEAAAGIGMRFHASRGAMSVGQSQGGLPPDAVVEDEAEILRDTPPADRDASRSRAAGDAADRRRALLAVLGQPRSDARGRRAGAQLWRVAAHPSGRERQRRQLQPRAFRHDAGRVCRGFGWVGHDVWHAHCVQLDDPGIALFARTGTGVAHCPCSNMRLASGIAPIRRMRDAGVPVGLGVDGSASNDGGHMLDEARQALLLQRVGFGPAALSARDALEMATLGGAKVLGRDDIGALAPGMAADLVAFDLRGIGFAGGLHDPVAALVFCASGYGQPGDHQWPGRRPRRPSW